MPQPDVYVSATAWLWLRQTVSNVWNVQGLDCRQQPIACQYPNPVQQVAKLVSQSTLSKEKSCGISMCISNTPRWQSQNMRFVCPRIKLREEKKKRKSRRSDAEAGFICTKWLRKWDSVLTTECVNIIMGPAYANTAELAHGAGYPGYLLSEVCMVLLMSNTYALESAATWPVASALDFHLWMDASTARRCQVPCTCTDNRCD